MTLQLDAIGIVVKNLPEAARFYSLLGLNFPKIKAGEDHLEAKTRSGVRVMLDTEELIKKINPAWTPPSGQRMALAFLCASPSEVDLAYKKITASGFQGKQKPWDAFWGQRYASVIDPDGNSVDLFAPL